MKERVRFPFQAAAVYFLTYGMSMTYKIYILYSRETLFIFIFYFFMVLVAELVPRQKQRTKKQKNSTENSISGPSKSLGKDEEIISSGYLKCY